MNEVPGAKLHVGVGSDKSRVHFPCDTRILFRHKARHPVGAHRPVGLKSCVVKVAALYPPAVLFPRFDGVDDGLR